MFKTGPLGWLALLLCLFGPVGLAAQPRPAAAPLVTPEVRRALEEVRASALRAHVRYLADDLLEGRDTGSTGGELAARYLAAQFEQIGLQPAGDNGTYYQQVPFVATSPDTSESVLALQGPASSATLQFGRDFLLNGPSQAPVNVEAPLVFAGYGITAPEFSYDDYAGLDVKGRIVVLLAGEPTSTDPAFFAGSKDTRYASGGSKVSLAASRGAAAVITIPAQGRAFPWEDVLRSQARERISLPVVGPLRPAAPTLPAFVLRPESAGPLFEGAPSGWAAVRDLIPHGKVKPFPLPARARLRFAARETPRPAPNVIALLEGSDPFLKKQVVVYTAHYDHVGRGTGSGDTIFNGAWDNASGTAAVLEIARGLAAMQPAPKRSVLFLMVTGEERGLLGSRYYVRKPAVPIEETAANINLDMTDIFGVPKEFVPLGAERSTLMRSCEAVARELGMKVGPDPTPELRTFFRSDQYSFAMAGVPSLFLRWANEYEDVDAGTAKANAKEKLSTIYHKVGDHFDPSWSWEGMRRHAQVALLIGLHVANEAEMPRWNPGDQFDRPRGGATASEGPGN